jgi:hypothetical protein
MAAEADAHKVTGMRRSGIRTALVLCTVGSAALLTGCEATTGGGVVGGTSATGGAGGAPAGTYGTSPLANPDGTKAGLAPLTSAADQAQARKIIEKVATKGRGPKTGYDRDKFGSAWLDTADGVALARNGCDTRNDLLERDGKDLTYRGTKKCIVMSMTLNDPYTGKAIGWKKATASAVQIDHVMPLSYDWQMGAARWTKEKREGIANDPLNLLPVNGSLNASKGDSGPASWLPPNKNIRCSYSVRFAQVSLKYELPVTAADKQIMLTQCGS